MKDIDAVLDKVDIVDVISDYVELERKGKNFFGVCPFHDDTNPSMSVSPDKQLFKCFSCGAGGNAITFVKDIEHISYGDALHKIAKNVGVEISNFSRKQFQHDSYYDIYEHCSKFFKYSLLHTSFGEEYKQYLIKNRLFDDKTLDHFMIGYSDVRVLETLREKFAESDIQRANILSRSGHLSFGRRIMFPIKNIHGNVVGFSGRVINNTTPKYINSVESKYFKKSEILYNFYDAIEYITKTKSVIICEGFFDVMRLYMNGIYNAVATMGTAFTSQHVDLVSKYARKVFLSMDNDEAGKKATEVIYKMLSNKGLQIFVVNLDGLDPDEYILKNGIASYSKKLLVEKLYEEYYIENTLKSYMEVSVSEKRKMISDVTEFIQNISDKTTQQVFVNYVYDITQVMINSITYSTQSNIITQRKIKNEDASMNEAIERQLYINETAIKKCETEFISFMLKDRRAIEVYVNYIKKLNIELNEHTALLVKDYYATNKGEDIKTFIIEKNDANNDYSKDELNSILDLIKCASEIQMRFSEEVAVDYIERILSYSFKKRMLIVEEKIKNGDEDALKEMIKIRNDMEMIISQRRLEYGN